MLRVLVPELSNAYDDLTTDQKDWGWFAWFGDQTSASPSMCFVMTRITAATECI